MPDDFFYHFIITRISQLFSIEGAGCKASGSGIVKRRVIGPVAESMDRYGNKILTGLG